VPGDGARAKLDSRDVQAHRAALRRLLDGIGFFSADDNGDGGEGFTIEFGSYEKIRSFSLTWPDLKRDMESKTASLQQIITCLREHKTIVIPTPDDEAYFQEVKALADAKKITITKITPCYGEGRFGEDPPDREMPNIVAPFAELDAVADFGGSNVTVRIVSPILASEVARLLARH